MVISHQIFQTSLITSLSRHSGLMLCTQTILSLPVQYAKRRFGQKVLYFLGGLSGALSGVIDITASIERSFVLLCVGAIFAGVANSLVNFLRFEVRERDNKVLLCP